MKILHIFKVIFALVFLGHICYGSEINDDHVNEQQTRTVTVKISTCDQFIVFPIKITGYFLKHAGIAFGQGVKSLYYAAYGYEYGQKVDRLAKLKDGLSFTLGGPLISLAFTGGYAYSLYNGGTFG